MRLLGVTETQVEASGTWWAENVDQGKREYLAKLLPTLLDEETLAVT